MGDLLEWAGERPLFTVNEAQRAVDVSRASLLERLSRMAERGELFRIERGTYTVHDNPLVYATHVESPSYLTLWSGLRFYDLTTQQPTRVQVMTGRHRSDLEAIRFYSSSTMFGFGKRRYRGFDIFVADPERLLIDCLARKGVPVSALEELLDVVDADRCVDYARRFRRKAVMKRVGYLLERHRDEVREELVVDDRNYPRLNVNGPDDGEPHPRWRILVNTDAIEI